MVPSARREFVNADIRPYLGRIDAYIRSIGRVNGPQENDLLRALQDVRRGLEVVFLQRRTSCTRNTPTRVYTGEPIPYLLWVGGVVTLL